MQHKILRAWDSGKNKVRYVYHDPESGRTNLGEEKTDWFFYVKTKDFNNNKPFFKFLEEQYYVSRYEHEHTYTRVYVDREHNSELLDKNMEFVWEYKDKQLNYILGKLLERNIQHYEADLKVYQRWIITNNVEFESEHKLVFLDIETDDSKMTGQPIPGEFQILSCAFCDSEGKAVCLVAKDMTDEAEEELLVKMAKVINHYDVLVAFNGCFVAGTKILMANGQEKNIENISIGDRVIGYDDMGKVSKETTVKKVFKHNQYKKLYKIKTDYSEIIATEEHPFLVSYNEKFDYVKTPYLRIGDYVSHFKKINKENEHHDYKMEDYIIAGLLMTDGHRRSGSNRCVLYNTNLKIHKIIRRYLKKNGILFTEYEQLGANLNQKTVLSTIFNSKKINEMLDFMGIPKGKKTYQNIDLSNIYIQDIHRIKAFLYGMWLGDGYKTTKDFAIANKNIDLRKWMIKLLKRLGIYAREKNGSSDGKNYKCGVRQLLKSEVPWYFVSKTPLKDGVKKAGLLSDICNNKITCTLERYKMYFEADDIFDTIEFEKIKSITEIDSTEPVYNFETETHNYVANDFIVHNCNFDFPYIKARFEKYGIQIDWRKKFLQDHMVIYKKLGPALPSYSLDSISKFVLGEGKVEHEEGITEMFLNNPKLFKEYNTQDVMLMYKIEQKTNFLSVAREVNTIGRCPCDDVYISRKIDMMVLLQAYEDGHFHFKTKEYQEKVDDDDEQFIGAFVKTPSPGLYENVQVFDFSSLYPNTIKTFNISPDTLVTDENKNDIPDGKIISCPSGHKFRKDFIGIIPKVIASTADKRNYYKNLLKTVQPGTVEHKTYDRLQYVFKYFGLSFYGVIGMKTSRFYDVRVAESVTLGGQFFIKKVIEYIEAKISPVIYGDTDSCFFVFKQLEKIDLILGNISKICDHYAKKQFNSDICTLEMAYDKGFSKFLLIAKKRYAGYITYLDGHKLSDPKLYVAGLEFKRTDVCKLVKTKQEELLRALLAPENMPLAIARKFVEDLKAYLFGKNVNLVDITFGQKLTKNAEDYKAKTAHLKVVAEMKEDGEEVWVGDKIQYFIEGVDKDGKGVPKPIYKFEGVFARTYYWNKKIFPALQRLLSVVYKEVDWDNYLITNKKSTARGAMDLW